MKAQWVPLLLYECPSSVGQNVPLKQKFMPPTLQISFLAISMLIGGKPVKTGEAGKKWAFSLPKFLLVSHPVSSVGTASDF